MCSATPTPRRAVRFLIFEIKMVVRSHGYAGIDTPQSHQVLVTGVWSAPMEYKSALRFNSRGVE
jgi:hypothetical protein